MKIKVRYEDFWVEERIKWPQKGGEYGLYLLEKRGWNTLDVLKQISKEYKIPFNYLAAAGRKDRYAITKQFVTIKGVKNRVFSEKNWQLLPVGEMDRPIGPDLILENRFRIVLRKVSQEEGRWIQKALKGIESQGIPNYYGEQRFGTYDPRNGFVGEKIVKKQFKGAVKAFLCAIHPGDKRPAKERKRFFFDHFDQPEVCLQKAKTVIEKHIFSYLTKERNYLKALYLIPQIEIKFQLSMFQSYLWNLFLKELIYAFCKEGYEIRGRVNKYFFPSHLPKEAKEYLSKFFPTPGYKAKMPDRLTKGIYAQVLNSHGINPSSFNFRKFRLCYIKPFPRQALVQVKGLKYSELEKDELYPNYHKLTLAFALPAGSYATILIKNLQAYIASLKGYS